MPFLAWLWGGPQPSGGGGGSQDSGATGAGDPGSPRTPTLKHSSSSPFPSTVPHVELRTPESQRYAEQADDAPSLPHSRSHSTPYLRNLLRRGQQAALQGLHEDGACSSSGSRPPGMPSLPGAAAGKAPALPPTPESQVPLPGSTTPAPMPGPTTQRPPPYRKPSQ